MHDTKSSVRLLCTSRQCKTAKEYFYFPNQILGYKQLITVYIRADSSIYSHKLCKFLSMWALGYSCYGIVWIGGKCVKPSMTAEGSQSMQFHSSCTLTLILPKIQLRALSADSNKLKKLCRIRARVSVYIKMSNLIYAQSALLYLV